MRDMKKAILSLIVILGLFVSACAPRFAYFTTETPCPQCVVDSLLQPNKQYYHDWPTFSVVGINHGDSTLISTYVYVKDERTIRVVEYANDYYVTVSEKKKLK